jgi:hypothetical protein
MAIGAVAANYEKYLRGKENILRIRPVLLI